MRALLFAWVAFLLLFYSLLIVAMVRECKKDRIKQRTENKV